MCACLLGSPACFNQHTTVFKTVLVHVPHFCQHVSQQKTALTHHNHTYLSYRYSAFFDLRPYPTAAIRLATSSCSAHPDNSYTT
jgi:hypothetical protein